MYPAGARLVLGERAAAMRRSLGPTSWAALEVLTTHAPDGACVVASVRFVADELGVAKNTAHRAMRRLVDAASRFRRKSDRSTAASSPAPTASRSAPT